MLALSIVNGQNWRMPIPDNLEKADRVVAGRALKTLRERAGLSLMEAAARVRRMGQPAHDHPKGISTQRLQQIEKGVAKFGDEQIERLTTAVGATLEDFEVQRAKILGRGPGRPALSGVREESRTFTIPIYGRAELGAEGWVVKGSEISERALDLRELFSPSIGVVQMADDTMTGIAEAGAPVIFDRSQRPVQDKGCVVETAEGELFPRLFVGLDDEHVFVRSVAQNRPVAFKRSRIKGVYAVRFWGV